MAFFKKYGKCSPKELFDYTSAEICVVRDAHVPNLENCLRNINRTNNIAHSRDSPNDDPWYPEVPSAALLEEVKRNMLEGCERLAKYLRNEGVAPPTPVVETAKFVGQHAQCPTCDKEVSHLKSHVTNVHAWSPERYRRWKGTKEMTDSRPLKYCEFEGCVWSGMRLDMHLKTAHHLKATAPLYKLLLTASRKRTSQSATCTQVILASVLTIVVNCIINKGAFSFLQTVIARTPSTPQPPQTTSAMISEVMTMAVLTILVNCIINKGAFSFL